MEMADLWDTETATWHASVQNAHPRIGWSKEDTDLTNGQRDNYERDVKEQSTHVRFIGRVSNVPASLQLSWNLVRSPAFRPAVNGPTHTHTSPLDRIRSSIEVPGSESNFAWWGHFQLQGQLNHSSSS